MAVKFTYDKAAMERVVNYMSRDHEVRIGILSNEWKNDPDKQHERKFGPVELGMVHEFGSKTRKRKIPQRSFLRKTLANRKSEFLAEIAANRSTIFKRIVDGQGRNFLEKVGTTWRNYVLDTFDRQGPGWQELSPVTISRRAKHYNPATGQDEASTKILWETGALARSVHWEITEK
jgi:phage gpG-like protein